MLGALQCTRKNPQLAYIGPTYSQAKRVAWAYMKEAAKPFLAKPPQESELKLTLINGATLYVLGADNADSLRGMYLDGAVMDEAAMFRPSVFTTVIRPALSDRMGWGVFASTPRGKNHFYDTYRQSQKDPKGWFTLLLKASESGIVPQSELDDLRNDLDPETYAQEMECSFDAALKGAIYADEVNLAFHEQRVTQDDLYDPKLPLHWAFDIGFTDATVATAFQIGPDRSVRMVSVYATTGTTIFDHIEKVTSFPGRLGAVWLPHDAKQKNSQTGMSVVEQFVEQVKQMPERNRPRIRGVPPHNIRDGIATLRRVFSRMSISEPMTGEMVEALKAYRRQWDDVTLMFKDAPVHDWACFVPGTQISTPSGAKSIEYLKVGDFVDTPAGPRKVTHAVALHANSLVELVLGNGKMLVCTGNHKLFTQRGLVLADDLRYTDYFFTGKEPAWRWIRLILRAGGITGLGKGISFLGPLESSGERGSEPGCSTRMFGPAQTGLFQRAMRYITGIGTREITPWEISNYSHVAHTNSTTAIWGKPSEGGGIAQQGPACPRTIPHGCAPLGQPTRSECEKPPVRGWKKLGLLRWLGTKAPRAASGTSASTSPRSPVPLRSRLVKFAVRTILQNLRQGNSALAVVRLRRLEVVGQRVHDLTVDGENCFIANGVLSSNSDYADSARYMAVAISILDREEGGEAISPRAVVRLQELGPRGSVDVAAPHMADVYLDKMFADHEAKGRILRIS